MAEHTPGPWSVGGRSYEWNSPSSPRIDIERVSEFGRRYVLGHVSYPNTHENTVGADERRANARLIAAAPDLLALARQYAAECAECSGTGLFTNEFPVAQPCPDCAGIRAVIAKATLPETEGRSND